MHLKDNINIYLYDKEYLISLYPGNIYLNNYEFIDVITEEKVVIQFKNFKFLIKGENLKIKKMVQEELIIGGKIMEINFVYE